MPPDPLESGGQDNANRSKDLMSTVTYVLTIAVMMAVVIVLVRGLWNLMRGGSASTSNKLMQMRVLLQFVAVVLIVITLWLTGGGR
jgi:flagellar biosynthesis protein FlhB